MHLFLNIALPLILVPLVLGWILGRVRWPRLGAALTGFAATVAELVVCVMLVSFSVYAFEVGTLWWIIAGVLFALLALGTLVIGIALAVLLTEKLRNDG